ncbi:MAG: M23 family metallopeptidase [Clostridia bacterium]|nr:M23 family metallopeptidase [Clostridia bacterium]
MKSKINTQKIKAFFKKNSYYMIMGVCVLAIGAMITVAVVVGSKGSDATPNEVINPDNNNNNLTPQPGIDDNVNKDDTTVAPPADELPDTDVITPEPIVFGLPVSAGTIIKDYTMDTLVWSSTLKQYQVHNGIDFNAEEGASVVSVYDGTVIDVSYNALHGNVVKVDHGNGLVTSYSSLAGPTVTVGQIVYTGTKLGSVSTSATAEMSDGAHVHFTVSLDGQTVSPYDYMVIGDK